MKWKGRVRRRRGERYIVVRGQGCNHFLETDFSGFPVGPPHCGLPGTADCFLHACLLGFMRPNARYIVHARFHFGPRGCIVKACWSFYGFKSRGWWRGLREFTPLEGCLVVMRRKNDSLQFLLFLFFFLSFTFRIIKQRKSKYLYIIYEEFHLILILIEICYVL